MRTRPAIIVLALLGGIAFITCHTLDPARIGSPSDAARRKRIIISISADPYRIGGFRKLIDAYHEHHPEVEVVLELKGGTHGISYGPWLTTQLASGDPRPDIVSGNSVAAPGTYVNYDYYRDAINPYTQRPWDEDLDFDWFTWYNLRGERTMLAVNSVHITWFYNKDLFDRLGLKPPDTWRQFMDVCAAIKEAGHTPIGMYFDLRYHQWLAGILWDQYSRPFIEVVRAHPGDWCFNQQKDGAWAYDPNDPLNDKVPTINRARMLKAVRDGRIRYDTPQFRQFLRNLKEIVAYAPSNFLAAAEAAQGSTPYNLFLKQQVAMCLEGTWTLRLLDEDLQDLRERAAAGDAEGLLQPFRWGTFDTPPQDNPLVVGPVRSVESAAGPYISIIDKSQPQTDLAIDFVMFWLSPIGYQAFVDGQVAEGTFSPSGKIMIRGVRMPRRYEQLFAQVKMIGNAEYLPFLPFGFPPGGSGLAQDIRQALGRYVTGQISVERAARTCQDIVVEAVDACMKSYELAPRFVDHPELDPEM